MTETATNGAIARIVDHIDRRVLGQREAAEQLVIAYLAGGHALLEGVPGIGKKSATALLLDLLFTLSPSYSLMMTLFFSNSMDKANT